MLALAIDVILVLVIGEGIALAIVHARTRRGVAPRRLIPNLAAGFFLMLAVRLALGGDAGLEIAACLLASLVAHLLDQLARWRDRG